jgi:cytochrome P450
VFTRYDDQRALLSDPRISSDAHQPGFPHSLPSTKALKQEGRILVSLDNPDHDEMRRLLTRDFTIRSVEAKRPRTQEIVDAQIDAMLASGNTADLVADLALPVPSLVICELLGVPPADQEFFQGRSETVVSAAATEQETGTALKELKEYLGGLADQKAREPGDDLISRLARFRAEGRLSPSEVEITGMFLLAAGHETTANMIVLGTLALLQNPSQLGEIRDGGDPALVANAVEELLRYLHTPHSGRTRVAREDIEVAGHTVRAGEGLITASNICDRDPSKFPDGPDRLDIHRTNARHHTAFGFGIHQCLGAPLARMELQVVFSTLFRRIPTLRLDAALDDLPFKIDRFVYGVKRLPVAW